METLHKEIKKNFPKEDKLNFIFFNFNMKDRIQIKKYFGMDVIFKKKLSNLPENNVLISKTLDLELLDEDLYNTLMVVFTEVDESYTNDIKGWSTIVNKGNTFLMKKKKAVSPLKKKVSQKVYDRLFPEDTSVKEPVKPVVVLPISGNNDPDFSIFNMLPQPTQENDPNNSKWRCEFYTYILDILNNIVPEKHRHTIKYVLNEKTLTDIWIPCFTSKYREPNTGDNYEVHEILGDSIMKYVFISYLEKRYGNKLNEDNSTILNQKYMSTKFQGLWGNEMKLNKWIIVPEGTYDIFSNNLKIKEDLLEAFCGALDKAFSSKVSMGVGAITIYNMIQKIFDNHEFELNVKPDKTTILQLMEMIDNDRVYKPEKRVAIKRPKEIDVKLWKTIIKQVEKTLKENGFEDEIVSEGKENKDRGINEEVSINNDGQYITKIYLKKSGTDILKKKGIDIKPNTLIGKSISATLKPGSEMAYSDALVFMEKYGITMEWIKEKQKEKNKINLEHIDEVLMKSRNSNKKIIEITIEEAKKLKGDTLYQIIGYDKDDRKYIIHNFIPTEKGNGKQMIIDDYLIN